MRGRGQEFRLIATGQAGLSAVSARSDHAFPRHTHDEFGFGLIVSGGQISASGRGQVTAGAGDLITVNPGEVHDGIAVRGEPRAWHMLYLSPERMADLASGFAAGKPFEFNRPVLAHASLARSFATAFQRLTATGAGERHLVSDENLLSLFAPLIAAPERRSPIAGMPAFAVCVAFSMTSRPQIRPWSAWPTRLASRVSSCCAPFPPGPG